MFIKDTDGDVRQLSEILGSPIGGAAFLAGYDDRSVLSRGGKLTVHVRKDMCRRFDAVRLKKALADQCPGVRVQVRRHEASRLHDAHSLESFARPFHHDRIIFDPTGVFKRIEGLVSLANRLRKNGALGVRKLLWDTEQGVLHLILRAVHGRAISELTSHVGAELSRAAAAVFEREGAGRVPAFRIGFQDPAARIVVPVDQQSIEKNSGARRALSFTSLAAVSTLGFGVPARAEGPAVSAPNAEIGLIGGVREDKGAFLAEGAVTLPLDNDTGTRVDGLAGVIDGDFVGGGAVHLFTRDPDRYLVGVVGGYVHASDEIDDVDLGVAAVEAEGYFGDVTLSGLGGYQFGDEDGFLGRLDIEWYGTEDLMLSTGIETNPVQDVMGRVGAEYRPGFAALPGLSLFAETALGEDDYYRAMAGVRFYFGPSPTLKQKHRRDTFRSHLLPTRMVDSVARPADSGRAYDT